jgi:hypothetical protein
MEKRIARTGETSWRRKEAAASLWRVAIQPLEHLVKAHGLHDAVHPVHANSIISMEKSPGSSGSQEADVIGGTQLQRGWRLGHRGWSSL